MTARQRRKRRRARSAIAPWTTARGFAIAERTYEQIATVLQRRHAERDAVEVQR